MPESHAASAPESWQVWLARFCENWIYAFLVAFAIKHFLLEPFRIPSASMEPMMYGDPSITRGDLVVVDKLWSRFRPYQRWDVTVFQFPLPELEWPGDARPATNSDGERIDHPLTAPLYGRNFVKRIVGLPGDRFFIHGGNLYLDQGAGFVCAHQPPQIQDAVWNAMYRHGDQPGYLPWAPGDGAAVAADGDRLRLDLGSGGRIAFTQPLINLYLKPNEFRVASWDGLYNTEGRAITGPAVKIPLAMTKPQFTYEGRTGNAWDLAHWNIARLKSDDLDNWQLHGTELNSLMGEHLADVRLEIVPAAAPTGEAALTMDFAGQQQASLRLKGDAWSVAHVMADGATKIVAQGQGVAGRRLAMAHVDDRIVVQVDGVEAGALDVPRFDNERFIATIAWTGQGRVDLAECRFDRDLHWSRRGFLVEASAELRGQENRQRNGATVKDRDTGRRDGDLIPRIRSQLLGKKEDDLSTRERTAAVACDEQHPGTIPDNAYLLLGDNSPHSWDGRNWGLVPAINLRGRTVARIFPPWRISWVR